MLRAIKVRLFPNKEQKELLDETFGCSRFIYNRMLEERIKIYELLKEDRDSLHDYKYKTEKQYKNRFPFLKKVDSIALQSARENLQTAYDNFFRILKKGIKKGFPKFKSRKNRQSYTTKNVNNNCKIDFDRKKLKLPKIRDWIGFRDDRIFTDKIKRIIISKSKTNKYHASILIEIENNIKPKEIIQDDKIIGFDMSSSKFLITKEFELSNPRFYRSEESKLKQLNKELSRKKKGSKNRAKAKLKLAKVHKKIYNRKKDWVHKMTHLLSEHFDCVILEDLRIKGMQQFNSGISKSITLDFSWNQFLNILKYKMEAKGKHLILIDRFFPSSKLCSTCGFKHDELKLSDRKWLCPNCKTIHNRDVNASVNIKNEGLKILEDNNIKIISEENDDVVGTTINAFGEDVRLLNLAIEEQSLMNYESIGNSSSNK